MHDNKELYKSTLSWLEREMKAMKYGEIGIVFSFKEGQITRIKKVNEESIAPGDKKVNGGEKVK